MEPDPAEVAAIREMPVPADKAEVQRFLGMCQYLSKFCHNLSEQSCHWGALLKMTLYVYGLKVTKQRLTQLNVLSPQQPRCAIMTHTSQWHFK